MGGIPLGSSIGRASCSRLTKDGAPPRWRPALDTSQHTVFRTKRRYAEEGLEGVLHDHPQANRYRKLDDRGEAHLIALACSDAPEGHEHWTLRLLAGKVGGVGIGAIAVLRDGKAQAQKKIPSSRGGSSNGASRK